MATPVLTIEDAQPCTPSDTVKYTRFGFYVGTTGDITVMPLAQENQPTPVPVTFKSFPGGQYITNFMISRVMATGTTATNILTFGPAS
jgi:hypothetical protein